MDDSLAVRLVECFGDLLAVAEHLVKSERPARDAIGEALALEELHDEKVDAILVTDVEERADVRMAELGDRFRLALEAALQLSVRRELRGEDLDGDASLEPRVAPAPDFSHPTRANARDDFIRPETPARHNLHW